MGINSLLQQNMQGAGLAGIDRLAGNAMFPQSQMDRTQYSVSSQMPTSAEVVNAGYEPKTNPYTGLPMARFARGGVARFEEGGTAEDPFLGNSDFHNLSTEELQDTDRLRSLNELKDIDPKAYNSQLMGMLSKSIKDQYNINAGYEPTWRQFAALKETDPAQWHKEQLGFLGHQQGWQIGQNTSERNAAGVPVIQDEIEQAKKAGLNDDEIQKILGTSSQAANMQNQQRIINQQQAGNGPLGMTTKDYLTVAAILGSGAAAAYFAPVAAGAGAGGSGIGLSASSVPSLTAGLELGAGAGAGAGAGGFGLTGASTGGIGLTAASVPSLATGLEVGTAGALGGAGAAGSGLPSLKEAYNAYKYANQANKLLSGLTGGQQTGYGINPAATSPGYSAFDPGVRVTGLPEIASGYEKTPWANLLPEITLSKLSEFAPEREMASGGIAHLGGYSDGGRLLKGPGDGMSDNIPASIGDKQPARLADGEFVIPADVVSHLGNGSTDAGAKQLYAMMDKVRKARTGNKKQGKQINPNKFLPKG